MITQQLPLGQQRWAPCAVPPNSANCKAKSPRARAAQLPLLPAARAPEPLAGKRPRCWHHTAGTCLHGEVLGVGGLLQLGCRLGHLQRGNAA